MDFPLLGFGMSGRSPRYILPPFPKSSRTTSSFYNAMQRHDNPGFNYEQQQQQTLRFDFNFNPQNRPQPNLAPSYSYSQQRFPVNHPLPQGYHQEYIPQPNYKLPGLANLNTNNSNWPLSVKQEVLFQDSPYTRSQDTCHTTEVPPKKPANPSSVEKPHPCGHPGCNITFRRIEHARRHRDGVHFKLKPFCCPYSNCGKKFARSDNLRQHIKSIHRKLSAASV